MEQFNEKGQFTIGISTHESREIADHMRTVAFGEVVKYADLTKLIGRNVQRHARPSLDKARKILKNEYQMVFDAVRGIGLKRLNDSEIVAVPKSQFKRAHRAVKKGLEITLCADYQALSKEDRNTYNMNLSLAPVIMEMTSSKSAALIMPSTQEGPLLIGKTLELFIK